MQYTKQTKNSGLHDKKRLNIYKIEELQLSLIQLLNKTVPNKKDYV